MERQAPSKARSTEADERKAARAALRRQTRYDLRLAPGERAALAAAAAARGISPAELLRSAFLAPLPGPRAPTAAPLAPTSGLDPATVAALARIGSNLNQLARRANSGNLLQPGELPETLAELRAVLARIETLVFSHVD